MAKSKKASFLQYFCELFVSCNLCNCLLHSIDGTHSTALCKFVNDDITGNCKMKKLHVNEEEHLCLFATKPIHEGDGLRYNYIIRSRSGDHDALFWRNVHKRI